jgi:hypothetical protein
LFLAHISVSTTPGATELTRIPCGPSSIASDRRPRHRGDRAQIDDRAASALDHARDQRRDQQQRRADVHGVEPVDQLCVELLRGHARGDRGVVDQHVDVAELFGRVAHDPSGDFGIREIGLEHHRVVAELGRDFVQPRAAAGDQRDARAGVVERASDRRPDPPRGTRHDCGPAFERHGASIAPGAASAPPSQLPPRAKRHSTLERR